MFGNAAFPYIENPIASAERPVAGERVTGNVR
jgi:hypothetical protein